MADLNPMVPGDVPYPQYSVTTTMEIKAGTTILKGQLYRSDDPLGTLVDVEGTQNFIFGLFQAKATPVVNPALAGDTVQVLGPRTRMIFTTQTADLLIGEDVQYVVGTTDVTDGVKSDPLYVGRIFEIYNRNDDGTRRLQTVAGDRVVVETVLE